MVAIQSIEVKKQTSTSAADCLRKIVLEIIRDSALQIEGMKNRRKNKARSN